MVNGYGKSVWRTVRLPLRWTATAMGINAHGGLAAVAKVPRFLRDAAEYRRRATARSLPLRLRESIPMLSDFDAPAGTARGEYFHQDLWAARRIYARQPRAHVDIGSRIDGFIAHLLVFMPVTVIDVRPLVAEVDRLTFVSADATRLEGFGDNTIESLSSLHAVEHFGLGRYGDPVAPDACFDAMRALARVLQPGGHLYFSLPIGRERLEFNAHRILAPSTIIRTMQGLRLASFSVITADGVMIDTAQPGDWERAEYACGLFEFTKEADRSSGTR